MRISDWSSDVCSSDLPHACANQAAVVVLRDRLGEQDTGCASFFDFDRYRQFIIQQGGLEEVDVHVAHHESQPGGLLERHLVDAARAHPLAAGALHETQVAGVVDHRSEEHTSEHQSLMHNSYAALCLKKKNRITT